MFNRNAFRTAIIFLGIIFVGIALTMFTSGDTFLTKNQNPLDIASVGCAEDITRC